MLIQLPSYICQFALGIPVQLRCGSQHTLCYTHPIFESLPDEIIRFVWLLINTSSYIVYIHLTVLEYRIGWVVPYPSTLDIMNTFIRTSSSFCLPSSTSVAKLHSYIQTSPSLLLRFVSHTGQSQSRCRSGLGRPSSYKIESKCNFKSRIILTCCSHLWSSKDFRSLPHIFLRWSYLYCTFVYTSIQTKSRSILVLYDNFILRSIVWFNVTCWTITVYWNQNTTLKVLINCRRRNGGNRSCLMFEKTGVRKWETNKLSQSEFLKFPRL